MYRQPDRAGRRAAPATLRAVRTLNGEQKRRRCALLLGTALASSLFVLPALVVTPAAAQVSCPGGNAPIAINTYQPIVCVNANDRTNNAGNAIDLETSGDGSYITVDNSGDLTAINNAGQAFGVRTYTNDENSPITIVNSGAISVNASDDGYGLYAHSEGDDSPIAIIIARPMTATAFMPLLTVTTARSVLRTAATSA